MTFETLKVLLADARGELTTPKRFGAGAVAGVLAQSGTGIYTYTHTHTHTHTHNLSISQSFNLSLSLTHTHTHTHTLDWTVCWCAQPMRLKE
jgi:hypothetical protein